MISSNTQFILQKSLPDDHIGSTYAAVRKPYIIMASVLEPHQNIILSVFRLWQPTNLAKAFLFINHLNNAFQRGSHSIIFDGFSYVYRYNIFLEPDCIKNLDAEVETALKSAVQAFEYLQLV